MSKPTVAKIESDTETETDIDPETEEEQEEPEEQEEIDPINDEEGDEISSEIEEPEEVTSEVDPKRQDQDQDDDELVLDEENEAKPERDAIDINEDHDTEVMTYKSIGEDECIYEPNAIIIDDFETDIPEAVVHKHEDKITKPYLTKYEFTCLLSNRVQQLSLGAKPMVKNISGLSPDNIARLEIKNKVIPLIILRPLPGKITEQWKITEFVNI